MPQPELAGLELLTALIHAQFDPAAADPLPPGLLDGRKKRSPKTIEQLRRQMAGRLAEKI